jgi:hypothetical protein
MMRDHALQASMARLLALLALMASMLAPQPALAQDGTCLDDVTAIHSVCEAGDVQISTVTNDEATTCMPGELVTLHLTVRLVAQAKQRYDIGLFVALDGGDAHTGSCHRDYLPLDLLTAYGTCSGSGGGACSKDVDCPTGETCIRGYDPDSGDGPFYDAELDDALDACGDLEGGVDTYYRLDPVTVECVDSEPADGLLDIKVVVTWDQQDDSTCMSMIDTFSGTTAKCKDFTVDVANVTVAPGQIEVRKSAEPEQLLEPGGWVTYTFAVENTSQTTVIVEELDDSVYGPLEQADGTCSLPQTLAPGETYTCTVNAEVIGEPGIYGNVVIVSGTDGNKNPVSGVDPAVVTIVPDGGMGMHAAVVTGGMTTVGLTLLVAGALLRRRIA